MYLEFTLDFLFLFCCSGYNGTVLVRLRAVAMERDDNSEGWVPIGAGGLSNVCVVKRTIPAPPIPDAPAATATSSLPGAPAGGCQDANGNTNSNNLNSRFEFVIYAHRLIDGEVSARLRVRHLVMRVVRRANLYVFSSWFSGALSAKTSNIIRLCRRFIIGKQAVKESD